MAGEQLAHHQRMLSEIEWIQGKQIGGRLGDAQGLGLPGNCEDVGG